MMSKPAVLVNIVLYHPDKKKVLDLIDICSQYEKGKVLLFDNSEGSLSFEFDNNKNVFLFKSPKNVGVGGAHHAACQMAEEKNFDFVIFLDQDSQLPPDFINDMISGFYRLKKLHPRLCAIGPTWKDPELGESKTRTLKDKIRSLLKAPNLKHVLISSGMLISVPTLKHIGYPKKEYFIDLVDTEWCLRALFKNYQIFMLSDVHMSHRIGEIKKISKFNFQYEQSLRYYYSLRNSLFLFQEKNISLSCKLFILAGNLFKLRKIIFSPTPMQSLIAASRGIKDGFLMINNINDCT
ncbi:glycosyltransferase family 2 protein [Rickettsiella endosymbiont of Miltochrista miniata]|uniref:glycosyltransferase family 2 protein n=1 Tax=Rickettsiella endosymbiont of Miltochrista miniata TaxID=3066239 RepID=UPI00313D24EB